MKRFARSDHFSFGRQTAERIPCCIIHVHMVLEKYAPQQHVPYILRVLHTAINSTRYCCMCSLSCQVNIVRPFGSRLDLHGRRGCLHDPIVIITRLYEVLHYYCIILLFLLQLCFALYSCCLFVSCTTKRQIQYRTTRDLLRTGTAIHSLLLLVVYAE